MRRVIIALLLLVSFVGVSALFESLSAQVVVEQPVVEPPVVEPTYVAVPPPQQEIITTAPSPQYVWVNGHWDRTPDKWNWVGGTWVKPPYSNAYWMPGYWQNQGGKYQWEDAHWAVSNQGVVVQKPIAVPPVYEEVRPAAPAGSTNLSWQPGHWEWRGTWVWIPGAYVATTTTKATWVQGQWVAGIDGTWNWSPAHWVSS
jgi:hypothetical protein